MQNPSDIVLSTATPNADIQSYPHKSIQHTSINNIGSIKASGCQMCSSISCNNDQNTAELSANCSENFTSRSSVNRSTALSDDMTDHEVTTNICLDASGNQCKP
ncbi:unnamed protein product [Schistosoma guineensis]|uniref:Uncharacterized protein n=1 Tax=Schistosoma curassoni TaxID=6186 RepID=A0A183KJK5_9TREM|nr:unnamed protein product [Schistosoma guineensis]VDP58718.1 unnamed protein product [Schistosoma curassoni]